MKALLFLFFAFSSINTCVFSQGTNNSIIGPSPNAAAFDKYGNIPVSTYTGVPDISIPIYTLTNKKITVPVSLSYHAGGIKVSEDASRIGLGWVLNCGGVINRSVRGLDDFRQPYGYLSNNIQEVFNTGATEYLQVDYSNLFIPDGLCTKSVAGGDIDLSDALPGGATDPNYIDDLEPDVFTYNFLGHTGKFAILKTKKIIMQSPDNLQFQLMSNDGTAFQVTTPEGNKLTFSENEYAQVYQPGGQRYISSWYLTKIVSPVGAEIDFHYTLSQSNTLELPVYEHQESENIFTCSISPNFPTQINNLSENRWTGTPPNTIAYDLITLDSVSSNLGSVILSYGDRIDIAGDKKITSLRVHNYKAPQDDKIFVFNQGYFTSTDYDPSTNVPLSAGTLPAAQLQALYQNRLELQSISEQNATGQPLGNYNFSYNATLVNKGSLGCDYWGFSNGARNNTTAIPNINYSDYLGNIATYTGGADRNPNTQYSQGCMLNQIQYPTGGVTKFEYESNDFDIGNSVSVGSYAKSTDLQTITSGMLTRIGEDNSFSFNIPEISTHSPVKILIQSQNAQSPITQPYPTPIPGGAYLEVYAPGATTALVRLDLSYEGNWTVPTGGGYLTYNNINVFTPQVAGTYIIKTHFSIDETFLNYINIQASTVYERSSATNHNIAIGGGLRIKKITDTDPVTGVSSVKKYNYHYQQDTNGDGVLEDFSYGKRLVNLKFTNYGYSSACVTYDADEDPVPTDYFPFTIYSNNTVYSLSPVVGYDQVTVLQGENGENGKSELHYKNQLDLDIAYTGVFGATGMSIPDLRPAGLPNMTDLTNGSLLEEIDYKYNPGTGNFVKLKDAAYTYLSSPVLTQLGLRKLAPRISSLCSYLNCSWLLAQYPAFQSSWTHLSSETVKEYVAGTDSYIQTTKDYLFESTPMHYQAVKTTESTSTGRKLVTVSIYPTDYAPGTLFIDDMKAANIVAPVEQVTYQDNSGTIQILSGKLSTYLSGGKGLMDNLSVIETASPIPAASFKFSNQSLGNIPSNTIGNNFSSDLSYHKRISYDQYDNLGNPLQIAPVSGPKVSYLWGYNSQYPLAEVKNASYQDLVAVLGQGVVDQLATSTPSDPIQLRNLLAPIRTDARLKNAQITTYTYDPLVGMTSSTDPKGMTTTYEYDSFQRLMNVKDQNGNIIKHNDYHYQNQ